MKAVQVDTESTKKSITWLVGMECELTEPKPRKVKKISELPDICKTCPQRKKDKRVMCINYNWPPYRNTGLPYRPCYLTTSNGGRVLQQVEKT